MVYTIIKIFTSYIMAIKIDVIISNSYFRLINNNINLITLNKFIFKTFNKI